MNGAAVLTAVRFAVPLPSNTMTGCPMGRRSETDSACVTLDIRKQQWKGYYKGNGNYVVSHSTYYTGTLSYTITSTIEGFTPISGEITVENTWDAKPHDTDYQVSNYWWTDSYAPDGYWHDCAGANTQRIVRKEIMEDWARRWSWLK
jgi:hypothetical protein